jgi:hypothetical protein
MVGIYVHTDDKLTLCNVLITSIVEWCTHRGLPTVADDESERVIRHYATEYVAKRYPVERSFSNSFRAAKSNQTVKNWFALRAMFEATQVTRSNRPAM